MICSVIIDPHIAVIRSAADLGQAAYDDVLELIRQRNERPQGIMLHFSAVDGDDFWGGTIYRDKSTMNEMFSAFTAPAMENRIAEGGTRFDIERDEFALERLFIEHDVQTQPFGPAELGEIAMLVSKPVDIEIGEYRALSAKADAFREPVDGRIAHIAYSDGDRIHVVDFWRNRAAAEAFFVANQQGPEATRVVGPKFGEMLELGWTQPHSFLVTPVIDRFDRNFVREGSGAVDASELG